MITTIHSHCNGEQIVSESFANDLRGIIENYRNKLGLYSISDFKKYLAPEIRKKGWSDEYYLDRKSKITITSVKGKTGLCIQTGNMARMYADLIKLQALYSRRTIDSGILVLPTAACGRSFGGNVASFERVVRELDIFDRVITMPLLIIGFDNDL